MDKEKIVSSFKHYLQQVEETIVLDGGLQNHHTYILEGNLQQLYIQGTIEKDVILFLKNNISNDLNINFNIKVKKDANVIIAYCDLANSKVNMQGCIELVESGAQAKLITTCLVRNEKTFNVEIKHPCAYTKGLMEHYALVQDGARYQMHACGRILKNAYASESHQATRVLTMSEHHHCDVIPTLLIDENDVKASHAMTLGQMDQNQLYYLQTRGLTRTQALGLLSIGYLLPIVDYVVAEDEAALKEEIEMKVGLHV